MLQESKIILILFFMVSVANASEKKPSFGNGDGCKLSIEVVEKTNRTKLNCPGLKFKSDQENLDNMFLRWGSLKSSSESYIVMFFTNGVHGERAIIFNRRTKKQVSDIKSSWPIEIKGKGKDLSLSYKIDSDGEGKYPPQTFKFK